MMCYICRGYRWLEKVTVKNSNEPNLGHVKFDVTFKHADRVG